MITTVEDKPAAAFTLSVVGVALQAVGAIFSIYTMSYGWSGGLWGPGMMMGPWMMMGGPWSAGFLWAPLSALLAIVVMALGVFGILWMNTTDLSKLRTGSTLVLVASIIAYPTMFGFMIGSLLMLVGGILGLTWQPVTTKVAGTS